MTDRSTPEIRKRGGKVLDFLALSPGTMGVLAMVILVGTGERMAERFLPIYMLALGGSALYVGVLQAMDNFLSAIYSFPGGYLSDRLGPKKSLIIFNLVAMAGFLIVILVPAWQALLAGAVLFISWSSLSLPGTMSLIYGLLPQAKRTMGVGMHSLVRRIPMALGPLLGGILIGFLGERNGVRAAFACAFIMAFAALVIQVKFMNDDLPGEKETGDACLPVPEKNPLKLFKLMNPALKGLLVTDILIRFCEQIPYAFVVVWCMKTISNPVSAVTFGFLTTVEMATAVLVYIPVAWMADRTVKKPFVLVTFVFFSLFPLVLFFSRSFEWLLAAFVLRGLKEFGEPVRKSLILDLSPETCRAGMYGLYYLIRDTVVAFAALAGAFLWQISPGTNLIAATFFGVAGTILFAVFGRDVPLTKGERRIE